jgi:DNA-binding HxlR family transcriptional regulator
MFTENGCPANMLAIKDAIEIVNGKWKVLIMISLSTESKRFNQLIKEVSGISDKMLSKELKYLELNKLVKRNVSDESSIVEYSITEHGKSLEKVMKELYKWGVEHRKEIIGK